MDDPPLSPTLYWPGAEKAFTGRSEYQRTCKLQFVNPHPPWDQLVMWDRAGYHQLYWRQLQPRSPDIFFQWFHVDAEEHESQFWENHRPKVMWNHHLLVLPCRTNQTGNNGMILRGSLPYPCQMGTPEGRGLKNCWAIQEDQQSHISPEMSLLSSLPKVTKVAASVPKQA